MPRKALPKTKKRSKQIIAKVTEREHRTVVREAKRQGLTISEYLRVHALGFK